MSHFQQLRFVQSVREQFPDYFSRKRILEVGSYDVNGSIRRFFEQCSYVGVDIAKGDGVDLVCEGQRLEFPTAHFDTVASCECFEHNPFWLETFFNMVRMLKPGGLCVVSCATIGRKEHGTARTTPGESLTTRSEFRNYYRNLTRREFERRINLSQLFTSYEFFTNIYSKDLYFVGIRKGSALETAHIAPKLQALREELAMVTTERGATTRQVLTYRIGWFIKKPLISLVGETAYHNARFLWRGLKGHHHRAVGQPRRPK